MKLKINESKVLEFEMDTSGCSWKELEGYFRLTLDNVEYGFPAKIAEGVVTVEVPVFKDVLNEAIKSSLYKHKEVTVKARLELVANNEAFIRPWEGEIDIEIPVSVKITEEKAIKDSKKKITVIDPDVQNYLDDEKKSKKKTKLMESFAKVTPKKKVEEKQEVEDKKVRKVKKSKFSKALT